MTINKSGVIKNDKGANNEKTQDIVCDKQTHNNSRAKKLTK